MLTIKTLLRKLLPLPGFIISKVLHKEEEIAVTISARKGRMACCDGCGKPAPCYDTPRSKQPRRWNMIPIWNVPVVLIYAPRRVDCPTCGLRMERVPWASGKHRCCDVFRAFLANWCKEMSWKAVGIRFGVGWHTVYQSVKWVVEFGKAHRSLEAIVSIGVDEICVRKGRQFWTLVYQIDEGARRLLWIGKDRSAQTFHEFFDEMGEKVNQKIQFLCSDLWRAYLKVAKERLPGALHVLDRFHVVQRINQAIDEIRRSESKAMAQAGLKPRLKKLRWAFLKKRKNWTPKERRRMRQMKTANTRTFRAFVLGEQFEHFWTYWSVAWAEKFFRAWLTQVRRSRLKPLKEVANSLDKHRQLLLNFFRSQKLTSGVVEGFNGKAKLTMKRAYGYRTDKALEVALFHCLGNLPTPKFTHSFF